MQYICCQPTDRFFVWQVALWLQSLQDLGEDDKAHVLLYNHMGKDIPKEWGELTKLYPKAKFKIYEDDKIFSVFKMYSPVIVFFLLGKYFEENPYLEKEVIYQCDSDTILLKKPNVDHLLEDDVCYLSDTSNYVGVNYLLGKYKDASNPAFDKVDIVKDMCDIVRIDKQIVMDNDHNSGGAQYLLKGMTSEMWRKIFHDSILLKLYLSGINRRYFKKGKPMQDWTAGMWSFLYNLWYFKKEVKIVEEMKFAWPTNLIEDDKDCHILHNAGITAEGSIRTTQKDEAGNNIMVPAPAFYKGKYSGGANPYEDMDYLNSIINNDISRKYGTYTYTSYLLKYKDKLSPILKK